MKLCINCKYYKEIRYIGDIGLRYPHCSHSNNSEINLINGSKEIKHGLFALRSNNSRCGQNGKWFEPKESK